MQSGVGQSLDGVTGGSGDGRPEVPSTISGKAAKDTPTAQLGSVSDEMENPSVVMPDDPTKATPIALESSINPSGPALIPDGDDSKAPIEPKNQEVPVTESKAGIEANESGNPIPAENPVMPPAETAPASQNPVPSVVSPGDPALAEANPEPVAHALEAPVLPETENDPNKIIADIRNKLDELERRLESGSSVN